MPLFDLSSDERRGRLSTSLEAAAGKKPGAQRMLLAATVVALDDEWIGPVMAAVAATLKVAPHELLLH